MFQETKYSAVSRIQPLVRQVLAKLSIATINKMSQNTGKEGKGQHGKKET